MPEIDELSLSHKELMEVLIKHSNIHEGVWALSIAFGIGIGNFGPDIDNAHPGVTVTVNQIGLKRVPPGQRLDEPGAVVTDAAIINPKKSVPPKTKKGVPL